MSQLILAAAFLGNIVSAGLGRDAAGDDDQAFDDAVRQFGYTGGAAWQCSATTDRNAIERQALQAYHGLARLFGTDQAFFFASSFGAGTMDEVRKDNCSKHFEALSREMNKAQEAK